MKRIALITFLLFSLQSIGKGEDIFKTGDYEVVDQMDNDKIFYRITLSKVYEIHSTKGYRNIYTLKWFNHENFDVFFHHSSSESNSKFKQGERMFRGKHKALDKGLYLLNFGGIVKVLKKYKGEEPLDKLTMRTDKKQQELLKRHQELMKEYNTLFAKGENSTELKKKREQLGYNPDIGILYDDNEIKTISKVIKSIMEYDAKSFYEYSNSEFRKKIKEGTVVQYFSFLKNVYGKLKCISLNDEQQPTGMAALLNMQKNITQYNIKIKFENFLNETYASLTLVPKDNNTTTGQVLMQDFNINPEGFPPSPYLDSVTSNFFTHFNNKKYSEIYEECHEVLKKELTTDELTKILKQINSMRQGKDFQYNGFLFIFHKELGNLVLIQYTVELDSKKVLLLNLNYVMKSKNHELGGINIRYE